MTQSAKLSFLQKAEGAWGPAMPDEVRELALYADRNTASAAAKAIGYSPGLVSHVLSAAYPGDMQTVRERIRGALMGHTVQCPALGEIGRDTCLSDQKRPFTTANPARARQYRACRSGCPHSRLKGA